MIEYKVKVCDNDTQEWYLNGNRHRTDGPAYIGANGYQAWFLNGNRHRTDGAARIWANGYQEWYLNGKEVPKAAVMQPTKELTVAEVERLLGYRIKIVK
jgi:hypothetical protein